jgi:peptidoglycan/xylan/chitin deacetylase (PgdA/CDA1 family)
MTILLCALAATIAGRAAPTAPAPVYVTLWFDAEDYILPQDDDATKRLAEMLSRLGVRATFKIVGEKARVLEQRGRGDVIAALKAHEIGSHPNTHSQPPTVAVSLQHPGWEDGQAEFFRRESPGVADIERIFGVTPTAYGQPGSAWAPQTYPALASMGIRMYLDEADHVGLDDQPFYYGGLLNVFRMRSMLARMELDGGQSLQEGKARFTTALSTLQQRHGGTISIYYHPSEWVHAEFWDAVNFSHGRNPPRAEWKQPRTRPAAETEAAFADFERYISFIKAQPGVRFVTASELTRLYADRAATRAYDRDDLRAISAGVQQEATFQRMNGYTLSAADAFSLLTEAIAAVDDSGRLPEAVRLRPIFGPGRPFIAAAGPPLDGPIAWEAFHRAVRDVAAFCAAHHRMPDEVWIGAANLPPVDYLAMLAHAAEELISTGRPPREVALRRGRFTADRYVTADSPALWNWVIFPEGFHAPQIMELARLQAWTLKPAVLAER